ncbi:MAG: extracellular solute-binding protein [Lachnospiraceae bacterium]|nr:extracellular solute-binding protein [Lachnospiraceae bacterium]
MKCCKKAVSLLLAGTMVFSLAGSLTGFAEGETADAAEEENLDFSNFTIKAISSRDTKGGNTQTIEKLMNQFAEEHPGFKYDCEYITDRASYLQKLKILAASDELPDWFDENPTPFARTLVDAGKVVNMGELLKELDVYDLFYPVAITDSSFSDGEMYSIPWEGNAEYFWYNKDLFAQAGVEVPKSFDEFLDVCAKLKEKGITPIAIGNKDQWPILRYAAQMPFRRNGNDFIYGLKEGTEKMNSEIGLESANFVQTLAPYFNEGWATAEYNTAVDLFVGQKAAIYYMGTWVLPSLVDENKELLPYIGYFKLPTVSGDTTTGADDYWANSGIQTYVTTESMCPEMKAVIKYVVENFADTALSEFDMISSMAPKETEGLPQVYQDIIHDLNNVGIAGQCWDVHLDPATLEVTEKEIVNVALGETTPEDYANKVDESIASYISSK